MGYNVPKRAITQLYRSPLFGSTLVCVLLLAGCHRQALTSDGANPIGQTESVTHFEIQGTVDTTVRRVITSPNAGILDSVAARNGLRVASGQVLARLVAGDVYLRRDLAKQKLASIIRQRATIIERWHLENGSPRGGPVTVKQDKSADILAARVNMQYAAAALERARRAAAGRTDLRSAVVSADLNVASERQAVTAALVQVRAAEAQLPVAENRHESMRRLYDEQAASREELRTALQQLQDATGKADAARATYNRELLNLYGARRVAAEARNHFNNPEDLQTQLLAAQDRYAQSALAYRRALTPSGATATTPGGVQLPPDTSTVDTEIIGAKADLAGAEEAVRDLEIRAPMDGTVTEWTTRPGETIQSGQTLGSVVDLKQLTVTCQVTPSLVPYMLVGTRLRVKVLGPSQDEYIGKVEAVSPTLDPQTNKQKVNIAVYDKEEKLSPGAEVTVEPVGK